MHGLADGATRLIQPLVLSVVEPIDFAPHKTISRPPEARAFEQGGTESVNWTIKGVAEQKQGKHIVTSAVEHVVVLECCKYLEKHHGFEVTYVGVDEHGRVSAEEVKKAIKDGTILVTIMHANNETGTINDIKAIAAEARLDHMLFILPSTLFPSTLFPPSLLPLSSLSFHILSPAIYSLTILTL